MATNNMLMDWRMSREGIVLRMGGIGVMVGGCGKERNGLGLLFIFRRTTNSGYP